MARISTHVLDTAEGKPAAGVRVDFYRDDGDRRDLLRSTSTNADGRTDEPLLAAEEIAAGVYEIVFHAGAYYRSRGVALANPPFFDEITIRFGVSDTKGFYHVPLLVTPYGYTTYRGS